MGEEKKGHWVSITVAVIAALGGVASAYVTNMQKNAIKEDLKDSNQKLIYVTNQRDSIVTIYKILVQECKGDIPSIPPPEPESPNIFGLPTMVEARQGSHYVQIKQVEGDIRTKLVTVRFLTTNEQYNTADQVEMNRSIGIYEGNTYHAIRGTIGDKKGEGETRQTEQMQVIKGQPIAASIVYHNVPSSVRQFSKLMILVSGDALEFDNVPISWK